MIIVLSCVDRLDLCLTYVVISLYVVIVEERSFRTVTCSHGLKISRERSTGTPDMPDMCTHVRQIRGWMMDVLVDLSFHVRALIRALFDLVLPAPQNCIKVAFSGLESSG